MKSFIVFAAVAASAAATYVPQDTPEVNAAKAAHFAAHAAARSGQVYAPVQQAYAPVQQAYQAYQPAAPAYQPVASLEDGQAYPAAEPYYHEEIAAEPYYHEEIPAEQYVHIEPATAHAAPAYTAPIYQAAPVQQYQAYQAAPVAQQVYSGCYNNLGASVECRY